jgi:hypothetical protein
LLASIRLNVMKPEIHSYSIMENIHTYTCCVGTNWLLKHVIKRKLEGTGRCGDVSSYWVTLRKREDA